jgi:hypothetical protein
MVSAIEAYQEFMSLRHHFTKETYDYFKYNGKIRINSDSFEKRRDFFQFQKLSKHPDLQNFILANLLLTPKVWIYELVSDDECKKAYSGWKKRKESFSYFFQQEINIFPNNMYNDYLKIEIIPIYVKGLISLETLYVMYMLFNVYNISFINASDTIILNEMVFKLKKYKPFMEKNFLINESNILNIAFKKFGYPVKKE